MPDSPGVGSKQKLKPVHFLIPLITAGLLTMFMNCAKFAALPSGDYITNAQSLCLTKTNAQKLASYNVLRTCENSSNYVCVQKIESKSGVGSNSEEEQCADLADLGHVCLSVDVSTVIRAYNQVSFHCANSEVSNPGQYLIQSNGASLDEALASAVAKCRARAL